MRSSLTTIHSFLFAEFLPTMLLAASIIDFAESLEFLLVTTIVQSFLGDMCIDDKSSDHVCKLTWTDVDTNISAVELFFFSSFNDPKIGISCVRGVELPIELHLLGEIPLPQTVWLLHDLSERWKRLGKICDESLTNTKHLLPSHLLASDICCTGLTLLQCSSLTSGTSSFTCATCCDLQIWSETSSTSYISLLKLFDLLGDHHWTILMFWCFFIIFLHKRYRPFGLIALL